MMNFTSTTWNRKCFSPVIMTLKKHWKCRCWMTCATKFTCTNSMLPYLDTFSLYFQVEAKPGPHTATNTCIISVSIKCFWMHSSAAVQNCDNCLVLLMYTCRLIAMLFVRVHLQTWQASSLLLPSLSSAFPFHFLPSPSLSSPSLLCRLHKYIVVKVFMDPQFYDVNGD